MQKWRSMEAVSAASIALFCCHAFCTQWSSPLSYSNLPSGDPEDYTRKVKKNFLRRATQNAAASHSSSGHFGSSRMQGWKGGERDTEVVKSVY